MADMDDQTGEDPVEREADRIARDAATIRTARQDERAIDADLADVARQQEALDRRKADLEHRRQDSRDAQRDAERDIDAANAELEGRNRPVPGPAPGPGPLMPPRPPRPQVG